MICRRDVITIFFFDVVIFFLFMFDQKSENWKCIRLSFAQNLEARASQAWNLAWMSLMRSAKCCKMPGLELILFLICKGKTNRGKNNLLPPTQIRVKNTRATSWELLLHQSPKLTLPQMGFASDIDLINNLYILWRFYFQEILCLKVH